MTPRRRASPRLARRAVFSEGRALQAALGTSATLPPHYRRLCALRSVEATLAAECERMAGVETGGVLAGFVDRRLDALVVVAASGPGPNALHRPALFNRDSAFCQGWLDEWVAMTVGRVDFVGEWHKHREPDPMPSAVDRRTFTALAANPECHLDRLALLIAGTSPSGSWRRRCDRFTRINAWSVRRDGLLAREIEWLPDAAYADLRYTDGLSRSVRPPHARLRPRGDDE